MQTISRKLVLTCEHASNALPEQWAYLFERDQEVLGTHRGWDRGAAFLVGILNKEGCYSAFLGKYTRLLVDLNRSANHSKVFSEWTKPLEQRKRNDIIYHYYLPYRDNVIACIRKLIENGQSVVHISVHSFETELNGVVRKNDIGLLYDPGRTEEKKFCQNWADQIRKEKPGLAVRMNFPYLGKGDGFTTFLRKQFDASHYMGIELETNQFHYAPDGTCLTDLAEILKETLDRAAGC